MSKKLKDIAALVHGELVGDGEIEVCGINGIKEAQAGELTFILNPAHEALIAATKASCVIAPQTIKGTYGRPLIKVGDPSTAFSKIIDFVLAGRIPHPKGIHPQAVISKSACIAASAGIGAYTVIEEGASVGENSVIYPFCYIGKNTRVGSSCILYPNVTVREEVIIGNRVIIHPGTVVGSDGFGYDIQKDGTQVKIPQIGIVVIEDDVELGACVTVDRARFAKTVIGKGAKIDNLVQIAHNVIIGPNCVIAAQSGISGSSKLGRNCMLGGQVGVSDHVTLGDFVIAGAKTGISKSFPSGTTLFWYPAKPVDKVRAIIASVGLLPKLFERVRALEDKIKKLEK